MPSERLIGDLIASVSSLEESNPPKNFFDKCGQIWQVLHIAKVRQPTTDNAVEVRLCFYLDFREAYHGKEKCMDR